MKNYLQLKEFWQRQNEVVHARIEAGNAPLIRQSLPALALAKLERLEQLERSGKRMPEFTSGERSNESNRILQAELAEAELAKARMLLDSENDEDFTENFDDEFDLEYADSSNDADDFAFDEIVDFSIDAEVNLEDE